MHTLIQEKQNPLEFSVNVNQLVFDVFSARQTGNGNASTFHQKTKSQLNPQQHPLRPLGINDNTDENVTINGTTEQLKTQETRTSIPYTNTPRTTRLSWFTTPMYLIFAASLIIMSINGIHERVCKILLLTPCLWSFPVVIKIITHNTKNQIPIVVSGVVYIMALPIWLSSMTSVEQTTWKVFGAITTVTAATIFFFCIIDLKKVFCVYTMGTLLMTIPLIQEDTATPIANSSIIYLALLLVFGALHDLYRLKEAQNDTSPQNIKK